MPFGTSALISKFVEKNVICTIKSVYLCNLLKFLNVLICLCKVGFLFREHSLHSNFYRANQT